MAYIWSIYKNRLDADIYYSNNNKCILNGFIYKSINLGILFKLSSLNSYFQLG